ncbi:MAG: S8 family serine peptidase, partial [Ignavibacteriota bacterium]
QDVAPSAQIYFATASTGEGQFATNIASLAAAGCKVITDDVIYFDEPVFEDGIVAQQVNSVASVNNVVYTSSSTNVGNSNYFGIYNPLAGQNVGNTGGGFNVHNYGAGSFLNAFTFPANRTLFFVLTWDDPYGASGNDFDLYIVNQANNATFGSSTSIQNGTQNPNEIVGLSTGGAPVPCNIVIVRTGTSVGDPNPNPRFKLAIFQGVPMQFGTTASSTWGHACATGALGCGAIGSNRTSAIGSENNYNTIEAFSAQGPVLMTQFGVGLVGGSRPILSTRLKPDVASFDGVTTSVGGFAPFYGTSASAPHVAGLAAQVISTLPGLTSAQYRTIIENGCTDYGAAGADNVYGYGRTDAFRTLALARAAAAPNTYVAGFLAPGTAITDNNGTGITSSLSLSPPCSNITPSSIYVSVSVEGHNKTGDLIYTLKSPDNTSITLMNRPVSAGGNATGKNPNVVFGDAASTSIQTANPAGAEEVGFFIPANLISTAGGFGSHPLGGSWQLTVSDNAAGNVGTLKEWGIFAVQGAAVAPHVNISWNPPFIYSGDHTLRNIAFSNSLTGGCTPSIVLQSVTSNEPDAGTGGGDIAGDIQGAITGANTLNFQLRSECSPDAPYGKGRYYTVTYHITDAGGYQRDTVIVIPVLCVPGRVDPSTDVPYAGLSLDVAPSPNPLTATSAIGYTIPGPSSASVLLTVCNNVGKWVNNLDYGTKTAGFHNLNWSGTAADGSPLPNGVYSYQIKVGAPYNALKTGVVIVNH